MVEISIGDKVGFLLPGPPSIGDRAGLGIVGSGLQNPTPVVAEVTNIRSSGLELLVRTSFGDLSYTNVRQDESRNTTFTWHTLVTASSRSQPHQKRLALYYPGDGANLGNVIGMTVISSGTISHPNIVTSGYLSAMRRTRWTSTTASNTTGGIFSAQDLVWRGNTIGMGGFLFKIRFAQTTNINGGRAFIGLSMASAAIMGREPSTVNHSFGIGYDSGDPSNGNWFLIKRGTSSGKTEITNMPRDTSSVYDLTVFCAPNDNTIIIFVKDVFTGALLLQARHSVNIPSPDIFLRIHAELGPAATATQTQLDISHIYLETDN